MPAVVRCKLCGKDHAYRDDIERRRCDECDSQLNADNARIVIKPRNIRQADPLEGM
jgi:hypothetical protein